MDIVVNADLKAYIDPLTPEEHEALERSILNEGCRDALVLWGDLLVDGHNRYAICQKHGLPFPTVQSQLLQNLEDVHLWMIDQHLGRRSVSDFQRGVLALRKREIVAQRKASAPDAPEVAHAEPMKTRGDIAKAARLSSSQAAVLAGKVELQQAAKRVRESRRRPREMEAATPQAGDVDVPTLQRRVAELTAENAALRAQLAQLQSAIG